MLFISDFDDTLVYTQEAVREAYRQAGAVVTDEKWEQQWGWPASKWVSPEIKEHKDRIYPTFVQDSIRLTPFGKAMYWENFHILTGASIGSVYKVCALLKQPYPKVLAFGCDWRMKHDYLRTLYHQTNSDVYASTDCVYFDDNKDLGLLATEDTGFTFCNVIDTNVVIYANSETEGSRIWTQLSSLLAEMNVFVELSPHTTNRS